MHEFLLELGLEEMPASVIVPAIHQLDQAVRQTLQEEGITFETIEQFSTPRRLALRIKGLPDRQADKCVKHKGPSYKIAFKDGEWTKAAQGFARGKGASVEDLFVEKVGDDDYVFVEEKQVGKSIETILGELGALVEKIKFPTMMHWEDYRYEYIRPVHWLLALLDDQVLPLTVFNLTADRLTKGHRYYTQALAIAHAKDYEETLKAADVLVDRNKRQEEIHQQLTALTSAKGFVLEEDQDLLDEVTDLVECPRAILGDFADKYLAIPDEVLITTMKDHQRFFAVRDQAGQLLPHFLTVANGGHEDLDLVRRGNEKVLVARLEDALFFYQEDLEKSVDYFNQGLENLLVHQLIGSMADKERRVVQLADCLAERLGLDAATKEKLKRAASIYKFDLVSQTVQELPELQGQIGGDLALAFGEDPQVALAIREQYLPVGASSKLPSQLLSAGLAFLDKLDGLISFCQAGLKPSSSNDPYGLRRQANGLVEIVLDQGFDIDWAHFLEAAKAIYQLTEEDLNEVVAFLIDRLNYKLAGQGIRDDVIDVIKAAQPSDFNRMAQAAELIQADLEKDDFKVVVENLARVQRLLNKATEEGQTLADLNDQLFETDSEVKLAHALAELNLSAVEADYQNLWQLAPLIHRFFEENMVMVDDPAIQHNRLSLLEACRQAISRIGDFSLLQVKR